VYPATPPLSNGELVSAAVGAGFTCLLTRDQLFGESAARALKTFPSFAVVVVDLPQQRWRHIKNSSLRHGCKIHRTGCRYPRSLAPEVTDYFPGTQSLQDRAHPDSTTTSIIGSRWHRSKPTARKIEGAGPVLISRSREHERDGALTTAASEELRRCCDQAGKQEPKAPDLQASLNKRRLRHECEAATMTLRGLEIENIATVWTLFPDHLAASLLRSDLVTRPWCTRTPEPAIVREYRIE
jgi:hypothetical protein